jgi:hypothetical protein
MLVLFTVGFVDFVLRFSDMIDVCYFSIFHSFLFIIVNTDDKSFGTLVNLIMCLVHPTCPSGSMVSANTSMFPCHNFDVSKPPQLGHRFPAP